MALLIGVAVAIFLIVLAVALSDHENGPAWFSAIATSVALAFALSGPFRESKNVNETRLDRLEGYRYLAMIADRSIRASLEKRTKMSDREFATNLRALEAIKLEEVYPAILTISFVDMWNTLKRVQEVQSEEFRNDEDVKKICDQSRVALEIIDKHLNESGRPFKDANQSWNCRRS